MTWSQNPKGKALEDLEVLKQIRNREINVQSDHPINPWDVGYYNNQILKTEYNVDHEKIREYLPMNECFKGHVSKFISNCWDSNSGNWKMPLYGIKRLKPMKFMKEISLKADFTWIFFPDQIKSRGSMVCH